MPRLRNRPLRGSIRQNTIRVPPRGRTPFGIMLRLGIVAGVILVLTGIGLWSWHVGWPQRQVEHLIEAGLAATKKARFAVKDIVVEGRGQTSKDALFAALGTSAGEPILGFDPATAEARIAKLPWIASAIVERRLPDTILVHLTERVPLARWQHDGHTVVIDAEGNELPQAKLDQFSFLPLVVGTDAPAETQALLDALSHFPAVTQAMTAAVRVSERRWDLHLQPQVTARLPENGVANALQRLSDLITKQKILDRDIVAIDLRLPDRLIIESGAPGATHHPAGDKQL